MEQVKLAVFDMAGTTVKDDHIVEQCFYEAAQGSGLKRVTKDRIKSMQGLPKLEVVETLWDETIGRDSDSFQPKVNKTYQLFKHILEKYYQGNPIVPTNGTLEAFEWLRNNQIKIALTTGFYRKVANIILAKLGWDKGFDGQYMGQMGSIVDLSLTPDETGKGRPHPDMIFKAMELLNITDPKQVIKVGDTPADLASGKKAGCLLSIAVTNGTHTRHDLAQYEHDGLIDSMEELPQFIENKLIIQ